MKPFHSKNNSNNSNQNEKKRIMGKPKILLIDTEEETKDILEKKSFDCEIGSLGVSVSFNDVQQGSQKFCLSNHYFPKNLHEFDIFIFDLKSPPEIQYNEEDHKIEKSVGDSQIYFLSRYPETIFNPRPLGSRLIREAVIELYNRNGIVIVFARSNYEVEYKTVEVTFYHNNIKDHYKFNIFEGFSGEVSLSENRAGDKVEVVGDDELLINLLNKYKNEFKYEITFRHPTEWSGAKNEPIKEFKPLLKNNREEIISFYKILGDSLLFVFPQMDDKKEFISELLTEVLPELKPEIFPELGKFRWLENAEYKFPEILNVELEKNELVNEYTKSIEILDEKIKIIKTENAFIHKLLFATGSSLVGALREYFIWLGFEKEKVIIMDEIVGKIYEEDLQINLDDGLLVIEVKGISGTSKDNECSQISKIKLRRIQEKRIFNVFALYIVNHQRYLSPKDRSNPPFTDNQIRDAINEDRGLLTTYQLFKLINLVNAGFISKDHVRNKLIEFGLIQFELNNCKSLGLPKELHHNGKIIILDLIDSSLQVNSKIVLEREDGEFVISNIEELQLNGQNVEKINNGEVGVRLSEKAKEKDTVWILK